MPFDCKRRDLAVLAAFVVVIFLYTNLASLRVIRKPWTHPQIELSRSAGDQHLAAQIDMPKVEHLEEGWEKGAANSTLGFGQIIAVSKKGSKRRTGLITAANVTGIDITIPDQPQWTEEQIESVYDPAYHVVSRGSALAWLGHINAVKAFLATNHTTALIIEDDVDWDIHLREIQVPLIAAQMRNLLAENPAHPKDAFSRLRHRNTQFGYWGDLTQWEILYLGHCGDRFALKYWDQQTKNIFHDFTVPSFDEMHRDTLRWFVTAGIGQHQRVIHRSKRPLCSFAYALNRRSAERVVKELSHEEYNHGTWAFDVRLLEVCNDEGWKCWTVQPELFHHLSERDSAITEVNGKPLFEPEDDDVGGAPNIVCGARTAEFENLDAVGMDKAKKIAKLLDVCSMSDLEEVEKQVELT